MQTYHVSLGLTSTGHTGTAADPMSWSDVRTFLQALPSHRFDQGNQFDSSRAFDSAAVDVVFRCRGTGALLSAENAISIADLDFADINGGIRFIADDPGQYGLPVISTPPVFGVPGVTALQPNQAWFKLANPVGVRLEFTSFVFDGGQPFGSDGYNLIEIQGGVGAVVNVSRNIFIERGVGHRFVYMHSTDTTSKAVVVGNTVAFGGLSSGAQEFARVETGRLFCGLNFATQSPTSPAVVMFATSIQQLYVHANAFALRASSLLYTGAAPNRYDSDVVGVNPLTQGMFNIDAIDPSKPAPATTNGLTYSESSGFWPVHGGRLLKIGSTLIPASLDMGMTAIDAFGYSKPAMAQDAGAFQKSGRSEPATVHVDLGQLSTGGSGTEESPVGLGEFVIDYSRRAPVDYKLTYVLRGSNAATPVSEFDMGPLSPNAAAGDPTYTGAGTVVITGYKTYNRNLPIFSASRITPNAHMSVVMERLKLEFTSGTDFIVGNLLNQVGELRIRACVIRSRAAAIGMFLRLGASTTPVHLRGCTIVQGHSNGTSTGVFAHEDVGDVHLCAINLLNQVQAGVGAADVRACSISTGASGTALWAGAAIDAFTKKNASNAFVDPNNSDFDAANFQLTDDSDAISILPDVTSIPNDFVDLERDCRGMIRSAFPNGSTTGDAGAYEYDFYVPAPAHRYLDLGKTRSGVGTPTDRWSPADLQEWCAVLAGSGELLDTTVLVHTSRSGRLDLLLADIDADPNGSLTFVADSGVPLWEAGARGNIVAVGNNGLSVSIRGMMLRNDTGAEVVFAHQCAATNFDLVNTIVDNKRTATVYRIQVVTQPQPADIITVTAATTMTFRAGIEYQLGDTIADTAAAIAMAIAEAGEVPALPLSDLVAVTVPFAGAVVVAGTALTATLVDAVIDVDTVSVRGCSFNDEFGGESGVVGVTVRADHADVGYTAFQGHAFSATTKSGTAIQAAAGTSFDNRAQEFTNIVSGGVTDTGSLPVATHLFTGLRVPDTTVDAFTLFGNDCANVVDASNIPAPFRGPDNAIDINARYRSRVYVDPAQNKYDVGAVERNYLDAESVFTGDVASPIAEVTDVGYALDSRALTGDVHFSLVGYAIGRGGYIYWDPTKPQPVQDPGAQARAVVGVVTNTLTTETVTVHGPLGTVTVTAGTDFDAGATSTDTAQALATALRSKSTFNKGFWCLVDGVTVNIYSWRFGTGSNGCSVAVTGSAITLVQGFIVGLDPLGVVNQVYPASGHAPWFGTEKPDPRSIGLVVRLEEGAFAYGELAVIARVHSSVFADEVGTNYVYARVRMPLSVKHARRTLIQRVLFAF